MKKLFSLLAISLLISCTQDAYEKGEGRYSLMRGDFAEASINSNKQIVSITTDEGELLSLKERWKAKWIETADTTYRCLLYYNKVEDQSGRQQAEIVSIGQVPCPRVVPLSEFDKELKTDPVKFESIWVSKTGKYLNMSLQLMTGYSDDSTAIHKLSFVSDTLLTYPDGKRTLHFQLHHDQNGVPEYYSTQAYVSLLVDSLHTDSVHLTINTYKGPVVKILPLSK